jgi:UDP-glucose 4-epimerase
VAGGPPLTLFGTDYPTADGTPIRDYVHVVDLAEAHRLALEATAPGDVRTDQFLACNLGSGVGFSVREVIAATERVVGTAVPPVMGERRAGDPPALVADITRARAVLRWAPERSTLDEMIGSAWAWLDGGRRLDS